MKLSRYFLPVLKDISSDAKIKSHQLMLRIGMIRQSSAGIYSWLPLGYKILKNIEKVVREEQDKSGAIEMLMPTIQSSDIWRESGRYESYGEEMLRFKDRQDRELLYGPTNEELITQLFRDNIKSYKSLPLMLYHIQWKFRDEIRPRFGIMRCREFLMKDTYHVYGCFCSPECAVGYLMNEKIDSSSKFERYSLLNNLYNKVFEYN